MGTFHSSSSAAEAKLKIRIKMRVNYSSDERSCMALSAVSRTSGGLSEESKGYQGQESVDCFTQNDLTDPLLR